MNQKDLINPCHISNRAKTKDGYPKLFAGTHGYWLEHRKVYAEFHKVKLGPDDFVCHHCDNPGCIEPTHLFLGTAKINNQDRNNKNRDAKGETNGNSKLTQEQVYEIQDAWNFDNETQASLAKRFNVSGSHINGIVHRKYWK